MTTTQKKFNSKRTIGEIVAEDYRKAAIFKKNNIDFCCGGGLSLKEACKLSGCDESQLIDSLIEIEKEINNQNKDFQSWSLEKLIDHIINVHHQYVKNNVYIIQEFVNKVKKVHGNKKPNVTEIADHFNKLAQELEDHMNKEELILFPYIKELVVCKTKQNKFDESKFGSIENPINRMIKEHKDAGDELEIIRKLTSVYSPPQNACATHAISYAQLKDFENDLLQHIHLENNILFPKAIALEKELLVS